jgi:putative oxidoreductase
MHIVLWILQVLLALAFAGAGFMKFTQPIANLEKNMAWVNSMPSTAVRVIGFLELAAAIGLIAPSVTRIMPILTPLAAGGLVLTMIGASILHFIRKEYSGIGINAVLGLLALVVAIGRFSIVPILPA